MAKWTNNMSAIYGELKEGYELDVLKSVAKGVGLDEKELRAPKAKRVSTKSAAFALATKANPAEVRAVLTQMGYDLSDMAWDDFEPFDAEAAKASRESESSAKAEGEGNDPGESAGDEPLPETVKEEAEAELRDGINRYFGGGQIEVLEQMLDSVKGSGGGGSGFQVKLPEQPEPRDVEGIAPEYFQRMLDFAQARLPILLVGPTGCGKTHGAEMLSQALDMRYASISCTEGMSESNLTGWLLPLGEGGKFTYVSASFVDFYENGGVFLMDEIDASDSNTVLILNTAVANGQLHLPQRHENPVAKKHKDFVLIAAANTYGNGATMQFVGRNQLDKATLDRFKAGTITTDYDARVEEQIVAQEVLAWGREMRDRIVSGNLEQPLSTRFMRDLSLLYSLNPADYGKQFWEQQLTAGWSPDEISRVIW